jgi:glycosyltransferase involved in cell wall biosynthesis
MLQTPTQPLVSIIIPAYNYGHLIGQTLDSLHAQTYADWECVVVDDGSTDDTAEVVAGYAERDARFRYVRQENGRQAAARNTGLRSCAGEYIQFLDADDMIEDEKLARQVEYLESRPDVDIVYSGVRYFSDEDRGERTLSRRYSVWDDGESWMPEVSGRGNEVLFKLLRNNIMVVNSPLVRRRVVESVGDFDVALPPVEDWDYWMRCAAKGCCFSYVDGDGVRALVRSHGLSSSLDGRRMMRATLLMRRTWAAKTLNDPAARRVNRGLIAEGEGLLGVEEAMHGRRTRGVLQLLKAAALDRPLRHRAKWLACALLAPFLSGHELRNLTATPLGSSAAAALRRFQLNARR